MAKVYPKAFRNNVLLSSKGEVRLEPKGKMNKQHGRVECHVLTTYTQTNKKQKQRDTGDTKKSWEGLDIPVTLAVVMVVSWMFA